MSAKRMTAREIQVVGDFLGTLSPYMVLLLSKAEVQEIAQNVALVRTLHGSVRDDVAAERERA